MRKAMAEAEVGDDVFGEDPTVNRLQELLAEELGKEAVLFVPSGTMGNEICLKLHTQPGQEVLCEASCHILNYESGAAGFISGIQMQPLPGKHGILPIEAVKAAIRPDFYYLPKTSVITIENTHNSAGGTIYPIKEMRVLFGLARDHKLACHIDGARIWNAAAATGKHVAEYARYCDSISVCFSKGLGAPVGSALAGKKEFVQQAHRLRKLLGGGMRQVGILAAAVLYALEHNQDRLAEDHEHARLLAEAIADIPGVTVDLESVQTNIVIMDVADVGRPVSELLHALQQEGVLVVPFGPTRLRAVTHLDISRDDIEKAIRVFKKTLKN